MKEKRDRKAKIKRDEINNVIKNKVKVKFIFIFKN